MRSLTGFMVVALFAATVFYWIAKFGFKSTVLSGYAAWLLVLLGVATMISLFLRDKEKKKK